MSDQKRHFIYSVAQYVHAMREERLNVGVVVYDPANGRVYPGFEPIAAARRIARVFPETDQRGLQALLFDIGRGLTIDPRVLESARQDQLFAFLENEWQNVIHFTSPRPFPATSAIGAIRRLLHIYVTMRPRRGAAGLSGATRAKQVTREAIERVLDPIGGILVQEEVEFSRRLPTGVDLPLKLPFVVLGRFGIDTLAFDDDRPESLNREAEGFIGKVLALRSTHQNLQTHATITLNPERPQRGRALIDYLRFKTRLPEYAVVEAEPAQAEAMLTEIKAKAEAA